nr:hypothetical protein [Tanacetum cinerariifolium]
MEIVEEVRVERSTELGSNGTKEMVNVLTSMEAANILTNGVAAVSVSPVARVSTVGVPTVNRLFPIVGAVFTTASVVTPYSRGSRGISGKDKGKEKVVESEKLKKKKLQEQIDAQVAREIEEEIAREDQRMNEQLARDAEIGRIHAEEELKMLIDGLYRSNEITMLRYSNIKLNKASHSLRRNKGNSICQSSEAMLDEKPNISEVKKEKEGLDSKLTCFKSASKDLDTLLGSQRTDKNKEGLGYNAHSSAILLAVASLFFWQWHPSTVVVGTSSACGNFITGSGNALCILFLTILP